VTSDNRASTRATPDLWLEIASAALMALATVLSAWCAYQATRWNGVQTIRFNAASAARTEAVRLSNRALQLNALDEELFTQYVVAVDAGNTRLAALLRQRFRPELRVAVEAWLTTQPFTNPRAPASPFAMAAYTSTVEAAAQRQLDLAEQQVESAKNANQHSDNYVLLTVLAASVLFFSGMGAKFQGRWIKIAMIAFGALILVVADVIAATFPIT
jgi:hypothetical protein